MDRVRADALRGIGHQIGSHAAHVEQERVGYSNVWYNIPRVPVAALVGLPRPFRVCGREITTHGLRQHALLAKINQQDRLISVKPLAHDWGIHIGFRQLFGASHRHTQTMQW